MWCKIIKISAGLETRSISKYTIFLSAGLRTFFSFLSSHHYPTFQIAKRQSHQSNSKINSNAPLHTLPHVWYTNVSYTYITCKYIPRHTHVDAWVSCPCTIPCRKSVYFHVASILFYIFNELCYKK